ncbi:cobalamin-binding protein [Candidatus Micrarchaeota archaeon]|nr:cobalamin-binding protein [Candidatus Micrarchaeota archaeon]
MKIISLAPSNTEILFALGAGDQVIARTAYCDYPEEAKKIPKIGDWINPNIDEIRRMEPDLIITSTIVQEKLAQELKKKKMPVIHIAPKNLSEVLKSIETIGKLVSKEEEAYKIVNQMLIAFAAIREQTFDLKRWPRLYIEEWHKPPMVSGNWVPDLAEIAGADYALAKAGQYSKKISIEKMKKYDPEIIVLSICGLGERVNPDLVKKRKGWEQLSAVRENKIYVIDDSLLNRPGPRLVSGCRKLQELILKDLK